MKHKNSFLHSIKNRPQSNHAYYSLALCKRVLLPRITRSASNPLSPHRGEPGETSDPSTTHHPQKEHDARTQGTQRGEHGGSSSPVAPAENRSPDDHGSRVPVDATCCLKALRVALAQFGDIGRDHLLQRPVKDTADECQVPQHVSQLHKPRLLIEQVPQNRTTS